MAAAIVGLLCASTTSVHAQPAASFDRPEASAVRIDASEAPTIDGNLSDPVWAKATVIDRFTQKRPNPVCLRPSERSCASFLTKTISISPSYAYDSQPDQIIAGTLQRDGPLGAAIPSFS